MNIIALDIETTGLNPKTDRIHGVGIAEYNAEGKIETKYLDVNNQWLRQYLADPSNHIVGHNVRFDLKFLIMAGFKINCTFWDTKLLAQLIDENRLLGLKDLVPVYIKDKNALYNKRELDSAVGKIQGKSVADLCAYDLADEDETYYHTIAKYCEEDCKNTLMLWECLTKEIKVIDSKMKACGYTQTPLTYYTDETMPLERVLMGMELHGIHVDEASLRSYREKLLSENKQYMAQMSLLAAKEIHAIEEDLYEKVIATKKSEKGKANVVKRSEKYKTKFNWQSSDHLSELIFTRLGISEKAVEKTETGKPSTSEASLDTLSKSLDQNHLLARILTSYKAWKKNIKLITTYTGDAKGLLSHIHGDRVYADYLQAGRGKEGTNGGTVTGRLSSRNPNMQQLPRGSEIKKFFIPDPGHIFVYFDYSQLELRLAAHLSKDPLLMRGFNEGIDLHQMTADVIGMDRQVGKATNFAMIYDASAYRLSSMIEKSVDDCQFIINEFFNLYKGYKRYLNQQRRFIEVNGLVVSETGRVRRLPEIHRQPTNTKEWRHALKQGYNFPIQSLGASITKRAMIELEKRGVQIVTQVHDSVVISLPENKLDKVAEIQHVAETIYPISVPLKADIKLLTSLSESDILITKEKNNEQCSNSNDNQASG